MTRYDESTITFPYTRSLGPVMGAFMTALTEKRILGILRNPTQQTELCNVIQWWSTTL